jgi:hypothetical protein
LVRFLKPEGDRIAIGEQEANLCRQYMRQHNTQALSEDGLMAYTICNTNLVECLPKALGQEESQ